MFPFFEDSFRGKKRRIKEAKRSLSPLLVISEILFCGGKKRKRKLKSYFLTRIIFHPERIFYFVTTQSCQTRLKSSRKIITNSLHLVLENSKFSKSIIFQTRKKSKIGAKSYYYFYPWSIISSNYLSTHFPNFNSNFNAKYYPYYRIYVIHENTRGYSRISNGAKFEYSNFVTFRLNDKRQFVQILWITAVVKNFSLTSFDFPRPKNITNSSKSFSSTSSRRSLHKCTRLGVRRSGKIFEIGVGRRDLSVWKRDRGTRKDSHRGLSRTERDAKTSGMRDVIRRKTGPDAIWMYNYEWNRDLFSRC